MKTTRVPRLYCRCRSQNLGVSMRYSIRTPSDTSLYNNGAQLLYILDAIIRGNYSQPKGNVYIPRFRPNSVQRGDFPHPRSFLPPPFHSRDQPQPRSRNDDRTNCYAPRLALLECVPEGLRDGYGTCLRLCVHVYARDVYACVYIYLCAWRP